MAIKLNKKIKAPFRQQRKNALVIISRETKEHNKMTTVYKNTDKDGFTWVITKRGGSIIEKIPHNEYIDKLKGNE